ncbi:MAG: hypothetical protein RI902_487 [Pseudomonadota bacterium]|jgi:hypothetical protein
MLISLIGTVHVENGLANVSTLKAILDRLQPEVIYAEISTTMLSDYLDGSHGNLESAAVAHYRVSHSVTVVPVDLDKPGKDFFQESMEMFNKVERTSSIYRRLLDQHHLDTKNHGFTYLNSERCGQVWAKIYKETFETLEWIGDARLREIYAQWEKVNDHRETAMIEKIIRNSIENTPNRGVLLVGTAHKKKLADKIKKFQESEAPAIYWNFQYQESNIC